LHSAEIAAPSIKAGKSRANHNIFMRNFRLQGENSAEFTALWAPKRLISLEIAVFFAFICVDP